MAKHQDLSAEYAHIPGYYQAGDPGAIGAGKLWIDISGGPGNWEMKLRNATDDGWEPISGGSGYTDHGVLLGLGDDDHAQYHNDARGDLRYSQLAHTHLEADITDLGSYLDQAAADLLYAALAHQHVEADITDLQSYSPIGHTHTESDITDLQDYLTQLEGDTLYADISHTHVVADITDFPPLDYLPLGGGVMTGHIVLDPGVRIDAEDNGVGAVEPLLYMDGADKIHLGGYGSYPIEINGSTARPQYKPGIGVAVDLALLSDVGGGGVTDHGALTGLSDDDHPQYLNETRGDARYPQIGDLGDYLPLIGGILSGPLQFSDDLEGIQFWDNDSAYFDALVVDFTNSVLQLGGDAVGLGGYIPIQALTSDLRIGVDQLGGSYLSMWSDGSLAYLPIISFPDGGPIDFGDAGHEANIVGSATRPTYNSAEIALLSDTGGSYSSTAIPRMQPNSGYAHISYIQNVAVDAYALGAPGAVIRVSPRDFIQFIRGGADPLQYMIETVTWSTPTQSVWSTDPTAAYIDLNPDSVNNPAGIYVLRIWVQDGLANTHWVECALIIGDSNGVIV